MNNTIIETIRTTVIGIAFITLLLLLLIVGGYADTRYSTVAEVLSVNEDGTIFVDGAGYVWSVYDTDYHKGQFVKLYFHNNTTDYTRNDDRIVKVKILDN